MDNVMYTATLSSVVTREEFNEFQIHEERLHSEQHAMIEEAAEHIFSEFRHYRDVITELSSKLDTLEEHNRHFEAELHYSQFKLERQTRRFKWFATISGALLAAAAIALIILL